MMRAPVKYPIGEQSFKMLREGGFLYVDKTMHLESLVKGSKYYFLGRPRRFGKSLFLSTLKCFFEGRRDLFKGLHADTMEWDWTPYPVLHIDLNIEKYRTPEALDDVIGNLLTQWEMEYGVTDVSLNNSVRFANIIRKAYESTGKGVVILVDEYDKPLVGNLEDSDKFDYFIDKLASLYSNFKSSADYIRFVFITGVSRFSHLSIFSGLNNINDISLDDRYSTICGISEQELQTYFKSDIETLSENYGESVGNVEHELKRRYDGYRFSGRGEYMYNPYSLLSVLDKKDYRNYWIQSGQTTLLLEQLKRHDVDLEKQMNVECGIEDLQGLDMNNARPTALLYQTGYLTIKDYDPDFKIYKLGIPNLEVREGLFSYIMPYYLNLRGDDSNFATMKFVRSLKSGEVDSFMRMLTSFFSGASYEMHLAREDNFQNAIYILTMLLGVYTRAESHTSDGRIDLLIKTDRFYYIMELKCDRSAQEALEQINRKRYVRPFETEGRKLIKIGVNFSTKSHTVEEWIAEEQ